MTDKYFHRLGTAFGHLTYKISPSAEVPQRVSNCRIKVMNYNHRELQTLKEMEYYNLVRKVGKTDSSITYQVTLTGAKRFSNEFEKRIPKSIILPIKPEYCQGIFVTENKRFEFRKKIPLYIDKVFVYCSKSKKDYPFETGKIIGHFTAGKIIIGTSLEVWTKTAPYQGIDYEPFIKYFGSSEAKAITIKSPVLYEKAKLLQSFGLSTHPQSYVYYNPKTTL